MRHSLGALVERRNPEREERRIHPAFVQARNIHHAIRQALREVDPLDEHSLSSINMCIDADALRVGAKRRQNKDKKASHGTTVR